MRAAFGGNAEDEERGEDEEREEEEEEAEVENDECHRRTQTVPDNAHWFVDSTYGCCDSQFNLPIPPGALPLGLRILRFDHIFDQPLQVGSIPDTVEVLQFGD